MFSPKNVRVLLFTASAFLISSSLFMNCAKDSLPAEVTSDRSQSIPIPLSAFYSPSPLPISSSATISVTGGTPPYTLSKETGAGDLTGYVYAAPATEETATIQVVDSAGAYALVLINVVTSTTTIPVTPGEMVFDTPGNFSFTVPPYNNLKVEVWGGGGGGQHCGVLYGYPICNYGGVGGNSSFDMLLARGGQGVVGGTAEGGDVNLTGEAGNWNGTNCSGLGGASGGPYGSATRQGVVPGGGGNGVCFGWGANGGGGGGYTMKNYVREALAVGSTINGIVGAGGPASGASGRVRITWN